MKAIITEISPLNEDRTVDVAYDIIHKKETIAEGQKLRAYPGDVVERITLVLNDFEDKLEQTLSIKVGDIIKSIKGE